MDARLKIGQTIGPEAEAEGNFGYASGHRDAYHIAAILVHNAVYQPIQPGENVKFTHSDYDQVEICEREERHAIVDPFIKEEIPAGHKFLVFLEPELVIDLTHHFTINEPTSNIFIDIEEAEPGDYYDECAGCNG